MRRISLPAAMVVATATFGMLLLVVVTLHGALGPDTALNVALRPLRTPAVISTFLWVTALAAGPALTAVLVTATAGLWAFGRASVIPGLAVSFGGAQATTWTLKYVVARPRPEFIDGVREAAPSFPSGHATASVALYGFLAYVVARTVRGRAGGRAVVAGVIVAIGLIDLSRLVLSLHFLTDVVAGNVVGAFWLMAGCLVLERRAGRGRGPDAVGRRREPNVVVADFPAIRRVGAGRTEARSNGAASPVRDP